MRRRRDVNGLTPPELDVEIASVILQLQNYTIERERESSLQESDTDDSLPTEPGPFERTLIDRLAQLRLVRKQRNSSAG